MNPARVRLPFGISRDLAVIAVAMLFWGLGEGLFIYFYPLSLQRWDMSPLQIGVVLAIIGVIMALVQVPAGTLSDRFGALALIRAGFILGVGSALWMGFSTTRAGFIGGLLAYSVTSFVVAPMNSYITTSRGNWSVPRALTFIPAVMQVGGIAGPILGGWIAGSSNLSIVFRYSAALFLASTVVVFFLKPAVIQEGQETSQGLKLSPFANPRILALLAAVFFTIFALNLPTQLASLYLQNEHQLSIQQIGITGTIGSLGTALIMVALGNLRPPAGMLAGQLLMAVFSLFLWRGKNPALFFSAYLFSGGTRLYHSMALAFARPLVRLSQVGLAYGLLETGNALAIILAPLAAGALYDHQPELVFIVSLLAIAVTIAMNLLLSFQRNQKGEQSP